MDPRSDSRAGQLDPATTGELRQLGTGMSLGRYTLLRKIASGGMAEIYAARSHGISGFEKKVALKKILPQYSLNKRFIDMLVDEAKITVSLTHPNIAQIYELGLEEDTYYIVMEYVDGRPLNRLMQRLDQRDGRRVPVEHAAHIMAEIAKGLHHAHIQKDARGRPLDIVHRDISPQNVLIAYTGDVKLIDFGIARAEGRVGQTSVGVIKGKLRYLAPEIAMGDEPDSRADVYCCGIVLFEMLTGEALFAPRTDVEAIELATAARIRSPRKSNPKIPPDLEDIVMHALRRNRNERYQTAKALYTDLRRFLNQHFPAYVGSELGDLMAVMFDDDMLEDRRLDGVAEDVIERMQQDVSGDTVGVRHDELAGPPADREHDTRPGRYKPVVTRTGIGEDDAEDHASAEPTHSAALMPSEETDSSREPTAIAPPPSRPSTRTADLPLVSNPAALAQTDALPAVDPVSESTARGADLADPAAEPLPLPSTARRPGAPPVGSGRAARTIPPPGPRTRIPLPYLALGALVVVLGLWAGFSLVTPTRPVPPVVEVGGGTNTESAPVADIAALVVRVKPKVAVDVLVGGLVLARDKQSPVTIKQVAAGKVLRIEVRADGYVPFTSEQAFDATSTTELDVVLTPQTGTVLLKNVADGARISASLGRVDGDSIVDVPLNKAVAITVNRPGMRAWSTKLKLDRSHPVEVEVLETARIRPGKLLVNSRPMSQIYINGRHRGRTPRTLTLSPGNYRVRLKHSDGRTTVRRARVVAGKQATVTYRWPRR